MVRLFSRMLQMLTLHLSLSSIAFAAIPLSSLEAMLPAGNQLGVMVFDATTNRTLVAQDSDKLLPPASTQKLVTALASRLYLPDNFRFSTSISLAGDDLVFDFSGDPTLIRKDLKALISDIKKRNIKTVRGDIWLDNTVFTGYERAAGWPWDILGVCYSAPSSAVTIDRNCVQGSIYSEKNKRLTRVYVPKHQPVSVASDALAISKDNQKKQHCDLELHYGQDNSYRLGGCLVWRDKPLPLKFAIQDPVLFMSRVLQQELKSAGIRFSGQFKVGSPDSKRRLVATHYSAPRDALLKTMLKRSDNLIADNLLKTLGSRYYKQPGSFNNGVAATKAIIEQKTGIDLNSAVLVDGSGLSRNNRMSAEQLMSVTRYIYQHPKLGLYSMLPTSGIDGTLKYRQSVRHVPLKGQLKAKSGSLYGSYNLAGVLKTQQGRDLLVVQLVTNYHVPEVDDRPANVASPITQFEREFYQALYKSELIKSDLAMH